jgi:glutathione S-transferase
MPTVTLHHLKLSRSTRVLWLLEELGLPYEIKVYTRDKAFRAPPELKAVHPLGKSPVVTVDDTVLAESGAIIEHLLDVFGEGRLRPEVGTPQHLQFRYWLHYAEGSLMTPLLVAFIMNKTKTAKVPFFIKPVINGIVSKINGSYTMPELVNHFAFVDAELAKSPWFAGDEFTAADIQMSYPVEAGLQRSGLADQHPHIVKWLNAVRQRPAYKRAIEKGGEVS